MTICLSGPIFAFSLVRKKKNYTIHIQTPLNNKKTSIYCGFPGVGGCDLLYLKACGVFWGHSFWEVKSKQALNMISKGAVVPFEIITNRLALWFLAVLLLTPGQRSVQPHEWSAALCTKTNNSQLKDQKFLPLQISRVAFVGVGSENWSWEANAHAHRHMHVFGHLWRPVNSWPKTSESQKRKDKAGTRDEAAGLQPLSPFKHLLAAWCTCCSCSFSQTLVLTPASK